MSISAFVFSDPETSCNLLGFQLIEMKSRQLSETCVNINKEINLKKKRYKTNNAVPVIT